LFLLHRGALHITLGQQSGSEDHAKKGPHLKGKAGLRVRVCERMGGFVGIYDPYDFSARLPIEVEAVKLTQVFAIERHALIDVFDHVGSDEASGVLAALMKEQQLVLEALKFNRQERRQNPSCVHNITSKSLEERKSCRVSERQTDNESDVGLLRQRRRSCNSVTVGSLLQPSASVTTAADSADAITATLHMWDDAVKALKASTSLLEDIGSVYAVTVHGFVKGVRSLEQLLAAVQLLPARDRPQARTPPLNTAAAAASSLNTGNGQQLASATHGLHGSGDMVVRSSDPPGSGARLLNNIAKMGQEMFSGFGKQLDHPQSGAVMSQSAVSARADDGLLIRRSSIEEPAPGHLTA